MPRCRNVAWLFGVNRGFAAVPPTRGTSARRDTLPGSPCPFRVLGNSIKLGFFLLLKLFFFVALKSLLSRISLLISQPYRPRAPTRVRAEDLAPEASPR